MAKKKRTLTVEGTDITLITQKDADYISLTDIAKNFEVGVSGIESWMRNRNTVEFLGTWEKLYNPSFNSVGFDGIKSNVGLNSFKLSVKKWIVETGAIGIQAKTGRYGGTYAHKDIAIQFCYWLSPVFQLYLIKEFQRLKIREAEEQKATLEWHVKRTLAKVNYRIHTDAVQQHLIPPRLNVKQQSIVYASEADLLNMALFGMTAKMWRSQNTDKKGNIRDHATGEQLLVLSNLENLNAEFIKVGLDQEERLERLNEIAIYQMGVLVAPPPLNQLPKPDPK
jgi:hypothetical protein